MVLWSKIDFNVLVRQLLPTFLRKPVIIALLDSLIQSLILIYNETFYTHQHDGRLVYLEKVLNDYYQIPGFNPSLHDTTRQIYIENAPVAPEVFIYQPLENQPKFLGDSTNAFEVFIDQQDETLTEYSYTIFIPDTIVFDEEDLRAELST